MILYELGSAKLHLVADSRERCAFDSSQRIFPRTSLSVMANISTNQAEEGVSKELGPADPLQKRFPQMSLSPWPTRIS